MHIIEVQDTNAQTSVQNLPLSLIDNDENAPYKNTKLCMRLRLVKRRLERTQLVDEAPERPNVGFGVICFLLHQFGRHVVWRLEFALDWTKSKRGGNSR